MAEPLRVYPLTVDDYHAMAEVGILEDDARVELIDGQLVEKKPIGPSHIRVVNRLAEIAVKRASDSAEVSVQNPVRLGRYTEPEPDVVLLRRDRDVSRVPHAEDVLLLIEVAESSFTFDRTIKLPRYAKAGIPEVWIVDISGKCIECHRDPSVEGYETHLSHGSDASAEATFAPALGAVAIRDLLGS